jgi:hypothetical protein
MQQHMHDVNLKRFLKDELGNDVHTPGISEGRRVCMLVST